MLFKKGKTCIKTNGFISKLFAISRSARQGCPAAPIVYIIQAKTPNVFILSEIHDMLVNLGRFPLNLPINNPFVFS
jgi:Zn-dependent protease with chaperone function